MPAKPGDASTNLSSVAAVDAVYAGRTATVRTLRALGWGTDLLCLGAFFWRGPLALLNVLPSRTRLARAQERLARMTARALAPRDGERILDLASGRGGAAARLALEHPGLAVVGLDLLARNVAVAEALYGGWPRLSFVQGDAAALPFEDGAFDRAQCLEAAFHFPDKARALAELARVLKPGGRLALVDFVWRDGGRAAAAVDERWAFVKDVWGFDDFATLDEYEAAARAAGLTVRRVVDWSGRVTRPLQTQFAAFARLGRWRLGRWLAARTHPMLRGLGDEDWQELGASAEAHGFLRSQVRYLLLVMERPDRSL